MTRCKYSAFNNYLFVRMSILPKSFSMLAALPDYADKGIYFTRIQWIYFSKILIFIVKNTLIIIVTTLIMKWKLNLIHIYEEKLKRNLWFYEDFMKIKVGNKTSAVFVAEIHLFRSLWLLHVRTSILQLIGITADIISMAFVPPSI